MATSESYLANGGYPADWREIALTVKERAGWQCEWVESDGTRCSRKQGDPLPDNKSGWKVVLSVAHLNHIASDCRMDNLKAMCSMHHLRYDAHLHARHAKETVRRKRREEALRSGQLTWIESSTQEV